MSAYDRGFSSVEELVAPLAFSSCALAALSWWNPVLNKDPALWRETLISLTLGAALFQGPLYYFEFLADLNEQNVLVPVVQALPFTVASVGFHYFGHHAVAWCSWGVVFLLILLPLIHWWRKRGY